VLGLGRRVTPREDEANAQIRRLVAEREELARRAVDPLIEATRRAQAEWERREAEAQARREAEERRRTEEFEARQRERMAAEVEAQRQRGAEWERLRDKARTLLAVRDDARSAIVQGDFVRGAALPVVEDEIRRLGQEILSHQASGGLRVFGVEPERAVEDFVREAQR
jgi:hypothetical protein